MYVIDCVCVCVCLIAHKGQIRSLKSYRGKDIVVTTGDDKTIRLWSVSNKDNPKTCKVTPYMSCIFGDAVDAVAFTHIFTDNNNNNNNSNALAVPIAAGGGGAGSEKIDFSKVQWLAAGGGYEKTPNGYILIWNVARNDQEGWYLLFWDLLGLNLCDCVYVYVCMYGVSANCLYGWYFGLFGL